MRKGLTTLMVILLAVGALLVSCNANVEAPADELVTISFDNESSRALSSNLETFTPGAYYWKYAAKKADSSNLISGQTADYDSDPESGALWIKEGEPGFGETSGDLYTPFKVQGFSQGLWNFRLFGYKKVIGDNPATSAVETEYYLLAYSGETTGVLLKQNGTNLVKAIVSPTQAGNGTLVVKITGSDKITLDPATPGLIPNTKIKLKVEKITSTATTTVFDEFVTDDYDESLEAGTYKVTVKFTNDDASVEFASGSVVSTVYANLTTTVKGNLTEIITSAIFGAEQNPDIITTSIGTASITQGTTASSVTFTSTAVTKVAATMPTAAAKSLIAAMEEELDAKTSSSTSQTSDLTLNLSVNTTEATETTVTYEIGMEATLIYEKKDAQASQKTTTKSTVETLDDFVTVVIDLRANLQDVSVTHSGTVMTECESLDILNGKTKAQDTTGIGFYFYDSASGKLYIKTWKFSPFQLSYTVPSYVAAIGSTMYESLTAAITAAEAGDTILILKDITTDDGYLVGKTISIDTNGHTITVNEGSNINNRAFKVTGGKLTVFGNGKIVAVGSGTTSSDGAGCYGAFRVESAGQLDVSDMTLINARPWGLNVKVCGGEVTLTNVTINSSYGGGIEVTEANLGTQSKKGSATLTDCTFTQTGYFDHCSTTLSVSGGSELIVNSGSYTSDNYALYVFSSGGVITVKGGTFSGAYGNDNVAIKAAIDTSTYPQYTGGLAISGGTFTGGYEITSPAYMVLTGGSYNVDPTAYVAEGYIADYNTQTSRWTVREATEDDYVASITRGEITKKYLTLPKAVEDAVSGDEILLLKDIELTSTLHITKSLTINGGSQKKTLSATSEYFNFSNWDKKNTILIYGSVGNPISVDLKNLGLSTTVRGIVYLDYVSGVVTNVSAVSTGSCPIWAGNGESQGTVSVVLNDCEMVDDNSVTTGDSTWARSGAAAMTGADLTINGGSYTGYHGIYVFSSGGRITVNEPAGKETSIVGTNQAVRHDNSEYNNCSEFVINGGSFNGPIYLQDDHPENVSISISGGTFTNVEYPYSAFGKFITGGTFDADPSAYVADGYMADYDGVSTWTVRAITEDDAVAKITVGEIVHYYLTLNDAFTASNSMDTPTIVMLKDASYRNATLTSDVTIDLNKKTITNNYNQKITANKNFTVKNGVFVAKNFALAGNQTIIFKEVTFNRTFESQFFQIYNKSGISIVFDNCEIGYIGSEPSDGNKHNYVLVAYTGGTLESNTVEFKKTTINWPSDIPLVSFASSALDCVAMFDADSYSSIENLKAVGYIGDSKYLIKQVLEDGKYKVKAILGEYWVDKVTSRPAGYVENGDLIQIGSAEAFAWFAKQGETDSFARKTITLTSNIDMSEYIWKPIRSTFAGIFDGGDYVISGIYSIEGYNVNASSTKYGNGIFHRVSGTIRNLTVRRANVGSSDNTNIVGVVTGYCTGKTVFENISIEDSQIIGFGKVAGIVGMQEDGTISMINCSVDGIVIDGAYNCAGFIGLAQGTVIIKGCSSTEVVLRHRYSSTDVYHTISEGDHIGLYWEDPTTEPNYYYAAWGDYYTDYVHSVVGEITFIGDCHNN